MWAPTSSNGAFRRPKQTEGRLINAGCGFWPRSVQGSTKNAGGNTPRHSPSGEWSETPRPHLPVGVLERRVHEGVCRLGVAPSTGGGTHTYTPTHTSLGHKCCCCRDRVHVASRNVRPATLAATGSKSRTVASNCSAPFPSNQATPAHATQYWPDAYPKGLTWHKQPPSASFTARESAGCKHARRMPCRPVSSSAYRPAHRAHAERPGIPESMAGVQAPMCPALRKHPTFGPHRARWRGPLRSNPARPNRSPRGTRSAPGRRFRQGCGCAGPAVRTPAWAGSSPGAQHPLPGTRDIGRSRARHPAPHMRVTPASKETIQRGG